MIEEKSVFVLKVGGKFLLRADPWGYVRLGSLDHERLATWTSPFAALEAGKKIFQDPYCHKFKVWPVPLSHFDEKKEETRYV